MACLVDEDVERLTFEPTSFGARRERRAPGTIAA
jgi:hypothetical protein